MSLTTEASCEMFNPSTNEWSLVSSPAFPRAACGIVSMDDIIYLFGGRNEEFFMTNIECFDIKRNEWRIVDFIPNCHQSSFLKASLLKVPKKFM